MDIIQILTDYKIELEQLTQKTAQALKKAPEGNLKIIKNKGSAQYYHVTKTNTYLPKKNISFIKKLAQSEYNKKLLRRLEKQYKYTQKALKQYQRSDLKTPYSKACNHRKELIKPLVFDPEDYKKRWLAVQYKAKSFINDNKSFYTSSGLRVRSKSELIIAETLIRLNIPFRYEYPVKMKEGIILHPDFYCLNIKTRQEIIWEHFGIMDDSEYLQNAIEKQSLYTNNGWVTGKNLILTMETKNTPLNSRIIEKTARKCLLT